MVPNLDCMERDELWQFWELCRLATRKQAEVIVGKFPRYTQVCKSVGNYACNKAVAMDCRRRGDILGAQIYETICESIYAKLPDSVKW